MHFFTDIQNVTALALNGSEYCWIEEVDDKTWRIWHIDRTIRTAVRFTDFNSWSVEVVKDLTDMPMNMTIAGGKVYVSVASGKIQRMDADGSDFQPDFITGLDKPTHLVVDASGGKLYWTEEIASGTWQIRSAGLDGSNLETVRALEDVPMGLAVDGSRGHLYVSVASGEIQRLSVDGATFTRDFITGLDAPRSLGVDVSGGKLYWTEMGRIRRASLTGQNIESVAEGLGVPDDLVLDVRLPTPADTR